MEENLEMMFIPEPASTEEITELLRIRKEQLKALNYANKQEATKRAPLEVARSPALVQVQEPINVPTPMHLLSYVAPHLQPHKWQMETMLQLGGFLTPGNFTERTVPDPENPLKLCLAAANGSGKDQYIIAAFAVWFAISGIRNRCIITSSSYEQVKFQTEIYIRQLIDGCNKAFGKCFDSIEFYHTCRLTGSEIKLFATDEAGKAEGYHPYAGGKMALIVNEAKTVREEIFEALSRCTGYSYWLEISSPAGRTGHFYHSALSATPWPHPVQLGRFYLRHISAYDCPHIPASHIEEMKDRMSEWWFNSSILALFSDTGENVIIPESLWHDRLRSGLLIPTDDTDSLGIGLDCAAGGDETSCFARRGPRIIKDFHFVNKNTIASVAKIDADLGEFKDGEYTFRGDDGGIGRSMLDQLQEKGWKIQRVLNQSSPFNKREFLNRGAEDYFHLKRLLERKFILPYDKDPKLFKQLTTRYYEQAGNGKFKLESKEEARTRSRSSPDHADAYVLCYSSFRMPQLKRSEQKLQTGPPPLSLAEFAERLAWGRLTPLNQRSKYGSRHTTLVDV